MRTIEGLTVAANMQDRKRKTLPAGNFKLQ
jgi:hypothetical protein